MLSALLAVFLTLSVPAGSSTVPAPAWVWPLPPPHHVVRGFEPPPQPWLAGHRGVDLAGRVGEPVLAAGAGVVAFAGAVAHVPVVSVRHDDGLLTTYQPVRTRLRSGDRVTAGAQIGRLVAAGSHCAPAACLHWGLRRGTTYLNPLALLRLDPVRLLPLGTAGPRASPAVPTLPVLSGLAVAGSVLRRRRRRQSAFGQFTTR